MSDRELEPIIAAGGIVAGPEAGRIAVVHRRRYTGEIALPKGKVKLGQKETIVGAAEREVREEIGSTVRATHFAGLTLYTVGARPKVVFYYRMELAGGGGEIDHGEIDFVEWVTPERAEAMLTHAEDRRLIRRIFALENDTTP